MTVIGAVLSSSFLPTPSARRATQHLVGGRLLRQISTHALREEGDLLVAFANECTRQFLPTPSARRATCITARWMN